MILAYDLSSRWCGYCGGDGLSLPEVGAFELPAAGDDIGRLLDNAGQVFAAHINRFKPVGVVVEKPLLIINRLTDQFGNLLPGRTDSLNTLRRIYSVNAHLEYVCFRLGVECSEVDNTAAKKEITGNRHAKKEQIADIAQRIGIVLPKSSQGRLDASDAWAVWKVGLRSYYPKISAEWDRIIFSPIGKLI